MQIVTPNAGKSNEGVPATKSPNVSSGTASDSAKKVPIPDSSSSAAKAASIETDSSRAVVRHHSADDTIQTSGKRNSKEEPQRRLSLNLSVRIHVFLSMSNILIQCQRF